jgi:hydroxypyruvate isomerase
MSHDSLSRRRMISQSAAVAALAAAASVSAPAPARAMEAKQPSHAGPARLRGKIHHSICGWPFMSFGEKWNLDTMAANARLLGAKSVELIDMDGWATLKKYGLTCAIAPNGMPGAPYVRGLNNLKYQPEVIAKTTTRIEAAAKAGVPNVIAFTGFKWVDVDDTAKGALSPDEATKNNIDGLKKLALIAEKHKVTVCVEHLNSRVENDDARGHPGYQGDDVDYCAELIRAVGSPRIKLLFDIYHVQIMNGDVITRIRQYGTDIIGHVHTAGNPGRREIDDQQEINYAPIMRALLEIKYTGYVGHEFVPTSDPMHGLAQAIAACDVA